MNDKEIIKELKDNLAKFDCMAEELQVMSRKIGKSKNFLLLVEEGDWKLLDNSSDFNPNSRYRLRSNYKEPEPEVEECCLKVGDFGVWDDEDEDDYRAPLIVILDEDGDLAWFGIRKTDRSGERLRKLDKKTNKHFIKHGNLADLILGGKE